MTLQLLRRVLVLGAALAALPASAQTTFTVNSTADDTNARDINPGDGQCVDGFAQANPGAEPRCTLRAAVDEANATPGDVVINLPGQLAGGSSGTYTLSRVAPDMAANTFEDANAFGDLDLGGQFTSLTIQGTGRPGPEVTVGPNDRVFHLLSGTVTIRRVTITGGTAQPGDNGVSSPGPGQSVDGGNGADGGCVLIASGVTAGLDQVSVNNCATSSGGNGASPSAAGTPGGNAGNGGRGGGIANFGSLTLLKSFVAENTAGDAGSAGTGTAGASQPVAGGNGGAGGTGGGVYNEGAMAVIQSTVFGNTAGDPSQGAAGTNGGPAGAEGEGGAGGGIATVNGGNASLQGSIVAGNTAGDDVVNDGTGPTATKQPGSDLYDGSIADDDTAPGPNPYTAGTFGDDGYNLIGTNNSVAGAFPDTTPGAAVDQNNNIVGSGQGDAATRVDPVITGSNRNQDYIVTAYELGQSSPAIDAGNPAITGPIQDGRGYRRPAQGTTADIGAFEFGSTPFTGGGMGMAGNVVINELDADQTGGDTGEFVELWDGGRGNTPLDGLFLVLVNGNDEVTYASYDLTGSTTDADGFFVIGNAAVVPTPGPTRRQAPSNFVQNGADAVALYPASAGPFPNGAAPPAGALDVVVYGVDNDVDQDLLDAFPAMDGYYAMGPDGPRAVQTQYEEGYNQAKDIQSLQRVNDGGRQDGYSALFYAAAPTPGTLNVREITVDETDAVAEAAGWRILSSPVISSGTGVDAPANTPLRVDFYAEDINLVQGAPAGSPASLYQAQYPTGEDILFVSYNADGTYTPAPTTAFGLEPGSGFYWYWYNNDVQPTPGQFGGGTSRSFSLDGSTGFRLDVTGLPLDDRIATATLGTQGLQVTKTLGQGGFVMLGNPYAYPYSVDGVTASTGTLSTVFNAYDPASGSYQQITADPGSSPSSSNTAPVWQGLFVEVTGAAAGTSVTFSAPSPSVVPTLETLSEIDGIYRRSGNAAEGRLRLALAGTAASGTALADQAAMVRFLDGGTADWDRHDGSKLLPLTDEYALIAPVGVRDGAAHRQGALSLPAAFAAADVPLALLAPAGAYTLSWDGAALPDGFTGVLVDRETGIRTPLAASGSYAFEVAEATDWTERFTLALGQASTNVDDELAGAFEVSATYPNPTSARASIDLRVAASQPVTVEVFDALGRRVAVAQDGTVAAGQRLTVDLPTADLAPGVYVVRVAGESFQESRRLTVVR